MEENLDPDKFNEYGIAYDELCTNCQDDFQLPTSQLCENCDHFDKFGIAKESAPGHIAC